MKALTQLVARSDDAVRPPALAPLPHPVLEVELLGILAHLSRAQDASVSARSTGSMLSEFSARKIRKAL